jgi:uncharacterized cupredoxin-like copper-binding protein
MKRLLIIGPLAALAVTGCGSSSTSGASPPPKPTASAAAVQRVPVDLSDFKIAESKTHLHPGKVTFDVKNIGKVPHEFLVIETAKPAAKLGHSSRVPEKGNIGETGNVQPGASKTIVLNLPKGHYAVICNDPGHYMAGMHKDLTVS